MNHPHESPYVIPESERMRERKRKNVRGSERDRWKNMITDREMDSQTDRYAEAGRQTDKHYMNYR